MPKVSVIIPAYNSMRFLPKTIESVWEQTFSDYEIIVINDGSSDKIEEWIATIDDPKLKLISQKNQGVSVARNTGIKHSKGEYIAFLDADDLWHPTKLEKQVYVLDQNTDVGLVYAWVNYVDENGNIGGKISKNYAEGEVWEKLIEGDLIKCGSVPMVRHNCFKTVGLFDTKINYAQGWEMWLRIAENYKFKVIKEPLTYYRSHPGNKSKKWEIMEENYQIIFDKAFANASKEQLKCKDYAYALSRIRIAWKILQTLQKVDKKVIYFQKQAVLQSPKIRYSIEYLRLQLAIVLVRFLGFNNYQKIRKYIKNHKRYISNLSKNNS